MKKSLLALMLLSVFAVATKAQQAVPKDSLSAIKQRKEISELRVKMDNTKLSLAKEQNNLASLQKDSANYQAEAQAATNKINQTSGNVSAGDVSSAKAASKAASDAVKANKRYQSTLDSIQKSRKKINGYNSDLNDYNQRLQVMQDKLQALEGTPAPPPPPPPPAN